MLLCGHLIQNHYNAVMLDDYSVRLETELGPQKVQLGTLFFASSLAGGR
jgi:hypothetical protein